MPANCDRCGSAFSLEHGLDYQRGGLVTQLHNDVRGTLGDIAAMAFKEVIREPVMREADYHNVIPAVIADLGIRGYGSHRPRCFLTSVSLTMTPGLTLGTAEEEKNRKYLKAAKGC